VSNSESEAVILEKASPKQTNARMHWFFTFNNYEMYDCEILCKVFNEICYMYAFQEETGECGTKHLQGIMSLKKRGRWTEFGLNKKIHWEKPNNVKDSYLYCTKEATRSGKVFTKNYDLPYTFKLADEVLFDWQKKILEIVKSEPDDRTVNWVYSEEGKMGKSKFVKHMVMNFDGIFCSKGDYRDICNLIHKSDMNKTNLVIFDLPRNNGNKISYSAIESIKNGLICNTKFETGYKAFKEPHIIVFANEEPDYSKLSSDRWNIIEVD